MASNLSSGLELIKWIYTLVNITLGLAGPFLFYTWDHWWILLPITFVLTFADFALSERPWKNVEIMKQNGLSGSYVAAVSIFNTIYFDATIWYMYREQLKDTTMTVEFNMSLLLNVLLVLAVGDYLFYWSHKLLHSTHWGSRIHLMHHCCIYTSSTTNIFFHPLDLTIEFFGPFALNYLWYTHTGNVFQFLLISGIMETWYAQSHDEHWAGHHSNHHLHINSDYPIYVSYNHPNAMDKVKNLVKH